MTPPNKLEETLLQVDRILHSRGCRKTPVFVKSIEAAIEVSQVYAKEKICPVFQVSNVTGAGHDFVRTFLNLLPASEGDAEHFDPTQPNYQAMLHCGAVRQTVRIVSIDHPQNLLRTGDRATVEFEFIAHPEFVKAGMKLLFREGKTKGLGVITKLL
ncbi:hypothetical protein BC834DRAFT_842056 [Gloeopeniophorella convolvens]|nr:hypothetical protein BC834DRAFT_842056 [Gloeopeniophorella convolvens]